jgi:hypothetical protein
MDAGVTVYTLSDDASGARCRAGGQKGKHTDVIATVEGKPKPEPVDVAGILMDLAEFPPVFFRPVAGS